MTQASGQVGGTGDEAIEAIEALDGVMRDEMLEGNALSGDHVAEVTEPAAGMDEPTTAIDGPGAAPSPVEVAEAWLAELSDQIAVPASDVQDRLLDLWGALGEGPARTEVEHWLTETLRRNVYSVSDINERLESLLPTG